MMNKNYEFKNKVLLDEFSVGYSDWKDNCWNYSIFSRNPNVDIFMKEYYAGFIQGLLQGEKAIMAARNNTWNNTYLCDTSEPDKKFPQNFDPSDEELKKTGEFLKVNYECLYKWLQENEPDRIAVNIRRLLFRMFGIYHGVIMEDPLKEISFKDLSPESFQPEELQLKYYDKPLSFMDIYFINAQSDLFDALSGTKELCRGIHKSDHCSAFLKRTDDGDIFWTHNTWAGYLSQTLTINYLIGEDFISQNAYCPGQFGSNTDFGFNGNGLCFNETTHRYGYNEPKQLGIWLCWRAAAAEMFAKDIEDFYRHISVDNTGTYLNGYMLIDTKNNETALLEMSYKRFVLFRSDGKQLTIEDSTGKKVSDKDYDEHLITPWYIFGVNYPVSKCVAYDLKSTDNRPLRRVQLFKNIDSVKDMESAKRLISYVENDEPLSIYGRWDIKGGTTEYPKYIPDGAVDCKVYSANAVKRLLEKLQYRINEDGGLKSFWMLYGTSEIKGEHFKWSMSDWKEFKEKQTIKEVPDELTGNWNEVSLYMD